MLRLVLLALICLPLASPAAPGAEPDEAAARQRAKQRMRQYSRFELTDNQRAELMKLLVAEEMAKDRATEQRREKMFDLLDDAQDSKLREMLARFDKRYRTPELQKKLDRENASRSLAWLGLDAKRYIEPLKLDEGQQSKLYDLLTDAADKVKEARAQQRSGDGRWSYEQWRAFALTLRQRVRPKIAELLSTDEQRAKFAEVNKAWDDRVQKVYDRWRTQRGQQPERKAEAPKAEVQRRLADALKALALGEEERAVIQPLLEQLIRHIVIGGRTLDGKRDAVAKAGSDQAAVEAALKTYRAQRQDYETKLQRLQDGLRELLTVPQEAQLVARGLLQ